MDKFFIFLLFFVHFVIVGCHHGFCNAAQTTKAPASIYPKTGVAISERPHPFGKQSHFCIQQDPCQTPLSRLPVHPAASHFGLPDSRHHGGILALQEMLESPQWQTSSLPPLRRTLEQDARPEFCATRARSISTAEEPCAVSACEKCAHFRLELGWSRSRSPSSTRSKWISQDYTTRSWKTQAEKQDQDLPMHP